MQQVKTEIPLLSYPVLIWQDGYLYVANTPLELCASTRSGLHECVKNARSGGMHMVEAGGRYFDIADWVEIPPFGGIASIPWRLLRMIFAAPVLVNEQKLSLPEFKMKVACAIRNRFRHDTLKIDAYWAIRELRAAQSYVAALGTVHFG